MLRAKLRRDAIFLEIPEGIYFRSGTGSFNVKGGTIYRVFSQLLPYLDGGEALQSYLDGLDIQARTTATKLINALLHRKVLLHHDPEEDVALTANELAQFRGQIEFIEHVADRPKWRFHSFRTSRVCLSGSGVAAKEAALALLRNGQQELHVANFSPSDFEELVKACVALEKSGLHASVREVELSEGAELGAYDLIIAVESGKDLRRIDSIHRAVIQDGGRLLPAYVLGDQSIVGPLVEGSDAGCWMCVMMRWSSNAGVAEAESFWRGMATGVWPGLSLHLGFPLGGMLGNTVAFEAFKYLVMTESAETKRAVLVQNLETLETERCRVLPHPLCPVCGTYLSRMPSATIEKDAAAPLSHQEILAAWNSVANDGFGLIRGFEDEELTQLPLRHSSVRLGLRTFGIVDEIIHGWSIDTTAHARYDALKSAIAVYSSAVFARLAQPGLNGSDPGDRSDDGYEFGSVWGWHSSGATGTDEEVNWTACTSIASGRIEYIPLQAVVPYFADAAESGDQFERTMAGVGVGADEEEMQTDAALSLYAHRGLVDLLHGKQVLRELSDIRAHAGLSDRDVVFCLSTLEVMNIQPRIFLVEYQPEGVMVAFVAEAADAEISIDQVFIDAGLSLSSAVTRALMKLIARRQSGDTRPDFVERIQRGDCHGWRIDTQCCLSHFAGGEAGSLERLAQSLESQGQSLLWTEITPPDIQETNTVRVCKVVLRTSERRHTERSTAGEQLYSERL